MTDDPLADVIVDARVKAAIRLGLNPAEAERAVVERIRAEQAHASHTREGLEPLPEFGEDEG